MHTPSSLTGSVPLTHWGLIRARGADAAKFLQGQLTNDVAALGPAQSCLAGFCSAKGRLQASFLVWRPDDDEFLLACAASVQAATLKRLSMFVMRAQCKLTDANVESTLHGVVGDSARALLADMPVGGTRAVEGGTLLRLADVDALPRGLMAVDAAHAPAATLPLATWQALEVRAGVPQIEAATVDQFVPQMLNYELIGGVDFKKGCYPGQEVVARSQYRGTIKRRMFLFDTDAAAAPGQEVFHDGDPGQPAGMVVNAAGGAALVEVKLAALDAGHLHLGAADGPVLQRVALPYAVPLEAVSD